MDIFDTFDANSKITSVNKAIYEGKYGVHNKKCLCVYVFLYFWYLVILDIVENNATFVLPLTHKAYANVHVAAVKGEDFKKAYMAGKFKGIDYFESDFTGYFLEYVWHTKNGTMKKKPIYVNEKIKKMLYDNVNKGVKYY